MILERKKTQREEKEWYPEKGECRVESWGSWCQEAKLPCSPLHAPCLKQHPQNCLLSPSLSLPPSLPCFHNSHTGALDPHSELLTGFIHPMESILLGVRPITATACQLFWYPVGPWAAINTTFPSIIVFSSNLSPRNKMSDFVSLLVWAKSCFLVIFSYFHVWLFHKIFSQMLRYHNSLFHLQDYPTFEIYFKLNLDKYEAIYLKLNLDNRF